MKKTVVRPFELGSILLLVIGLAFSAIFIYSIVSIIISGFSSTLAVLAIVSVALTYFISVNALRIVCMSKFVFYDTYFEVVYFENFVKYYSGSFYKIIPAQKARINYTDIDKFGSFEGHQMMKDGRDNKNNLRVMISVKGVPVQFVLPSYFENTRNYFVINDKNENGWLIDGKLYSVSQVKRVLKNIEIGSNKQPVSGYPDIPNFFVLFFIIGIIAAVAVPWGMIGLECKINPTHTRAEDFPSRIIYFVSCMLFIISILVNILLTSGPKSEEDYESIKKFRITNFIVSAVFFLAFVVGFIISVQ